MINVEKLKEDLFKAWKRRKVDNDLHDARTSQDMYQLSLTKIDCVWLYRGIHTKLIDLLTFRLKASVLHVFMFVTSKCIDVSLSKINRVTFI